MKKDLFQEIQAGRTMQCAVDHIAYPDALYGIMSFIERTGMHIALLRFGKDGIELATDPSNETAYIEYNLYFDAAKFEKHRQEYQSYLDEHAICSSETDSKYARDYVLKNRHDVMLYANQEKGILIYKDALQVKTDEHKYYLTSVFLPLIHASMNGKLSDSVFPEIGFPHSPLLPKRANPQEIGQSQLRYDGIYVMDFEGELDKDLSSCFRFFPTGMMSGCLARRDTLDEVFVRLDEETTYFGTYCINENKIEMHITGIGFEETSRLIGTIHDGYIRIENEPSFVSSSIWSREAHHEVFTFRKIADHHL